MILIADVVKIKIDGSGKMILKIKIKIMEHIL